MRGDVTDTPCKQWVEDCLLRRRVPSDPVHHPPHPIFPVSIVLSMVQGQVSRAVREKKRSDSVLLCCEVQLLWEVQELWETPLATSWMPGPLFKWFIFRKFSGCDGWGDTSFLHLSLLLDSCLYRARMCGKPSVATLYMLASGTSPNGMVVAAAV